MYLFTFKSIVFPSETILCMFKKNNNNNYQNMRQPTSIKTQPEIIRINQIRIKGRGEASFWMQTSEKLYMIQQLF